MKTAMTLLLTLVALMAALSLWLVWMEPRMIFQPARELEGTPARLGWAFAEVTLVASDGVRLRGWHIPRAAGVTAPPVTVLFLHGNAGNISHRFEKLAILRDLGADVLIVDYRGYGASEGRPDEAGLNRDALAAYRHLVDERRVAPAQVVLYGESLGSAIAVRLAAGAEVGGVVLEAAFTSAADVGQAMFPFLPVRWLVRNRLDTLGRIGHVRAPILLLHSRDDEFFPLHHAERLVSAAGDRARLTVLRGGHNDAFLTSEDEYRRSLGAFLRAR